MQNPENKLIRDELSTKGSDSVDQAKASGDSESSEQQHEYQYSTVTSCSRSPVLIWITNAGSWTKEEGGKSERGEILFYTSHSSAFQRDIIIIFYYHRLGSTKSEGKSTHFKRGGRGRGKGEGEGKGMRGQRERELKLNKKCFSLQDL